MKEKLRRVVQTLSRKRATPPELFKEYQQSQYRPLKELKREQWTKLKALLDHAYKNVPYYRKKWKKAGIKPSDIKTPKDFLKIPYTQKEELREVGDDILAKNLPKNRFRKSRTSGSTGRPWWYYNDTRELIPENVAWMNEMEITGFKEGDVMVRLRNLKFTKSWAKNLYFQRFGSMKFVDTYNLSMDNADKILEKAMSFKPTMLESFPAQMGTLLKYMEENDLEYEVPLIMLEGGVLSKEFIEEAERRFHSKLFREYGSSENMRVAFQCEIREGYHVDITRYYAEIVKKGKPADFGELVITNLNNWVLPLIRFRPYDTATRETKKCGCRRTWPRIKEIKGRTFELLFTKSGKLIQEGFIKDAIYSLKNQVGEFQIVQEKNSRIVVRIVPGETYDEKTSGHLQKEIWKRSKIRMDVETVKEIPRYGEEHKKFAVFNEGRVDLA